MTLLGKIFTVMIFIMSVLFMAFSVMVYSTHTNWRDLVLGADGKEGLKELNETKANTINSLNDQLAGVQQDLASERASRRAAISVLETQVLQQKQILVQKQSELDALTVENGLALQQLKASQDQLAALTSDIAALRADLTTTKTDRDAQLAKVNLLTGQVHELEGARRILEERRDQLIAIVGEYKKALDVRGLSVDTPIDLITPAGLEGIVTGVANADFIEISIGSDDGLMPGHELIVFRERTYLGKVIIRKTTPNRAVGQIIKDTARGQIKRGDRVASNLS